MSQREAGMGASLSSGPSAGALETSVALLRAAHGGPALAVTVFTALLAVAGDLPVDRVVLVTATVLTGQLTIGWSNDLLDQARDATVGRADKPLVGGVLSAGVVRTACLVAVFLTVPLALTLGWADAVAHVVTTGAGWAYNLRLKATAWSWLPYAVGFGGLPVLVALADRPATWPPVWQVAAGALLGVGAHFLNVLPDLADDERTGVRGLPHRVGERGSRWCAVGLLLLATVVVLFREGEAPAVILLLVVLPTVGALAMLALRGAGRLPFVAAVGIALVDVVLIVSAS